MIFIIFYEWKVGKSPNHKTFNIDGCFLKWKNLYFVFINHYRLSRLKGGCEGSFRQFETTTFSLFTDIHYINLYMYKRSNMINTLNSNETSFKIHLFQPKITRTTTTTTTNDNWHSRSYSVVCLKRVFKIISHE